MSGAALDVWPPLPYEEWEPTKSAYRAGARRAAWDAEGFATGR